MILILFIKNVNKKETNYYIKFGTVNLWQKVLWKVKKSSKTKIARVYASALYEVAEARKCTDKVLKEAAALRQTFVQNPDLETYLASPLYEEKDKEDVLKKTAKALNLSAETLSCLEVITQNHRIADLKAILEMYASVYYQKNNIAEVFVETVKNLSPAQDKKLGAVLQKLFGKQVVVSYQLNPALIGGLRVKNGSEMFDDSLANKLNHLENLMKGK